MEQPSSLLNSLRLYGTALVFTEQSLYRILRYFPSSFFFFNEGDAYKGVVAKDMSHIFTPIILNHPKFNQLQKKTHSPFLR